MDLNIIENFNILKIQNFLQNYFRILVIYGIIFSDQEVVMILSTFNFKLVCYVFSNFKYFKSLLIASLLFITFETFIYLKLERKIISSSIENGLEKKFQKFDVGRNILFYTFDF